MVITRFFRWWITGYLHLAVLPIFSGYRVVEAYQAHIITLKSSDLYDSGKKVNVYFR